MPIITVNLLTGRDAAKKRVLIREIAAAAVRALDVPSASVRVILNEVPPEHWGIGNETKAEQLERAKEGQ
ncbi:tautomerase family protein [Sphingomonas oryzagri]|uniref:Tautomerase family protein n=1 Tax=Sphingomonas oryzagri TaxID=3042314 RepID=A0ABT6N2M3_9SPHN|nr:tautomerase family protein [Sphingomonas oryzagri]MDH7639033.1 tautomerase family protein [Sphingomonas oryzagri]